MSEEKIPGQTRSPENLEAAKKVIEKQSTDRVMEAASNAEDLIRYCRETWDAEGFTPEQCVFALALATINFRETMPEKLGGKEMFDRVAAEARRYYDANKDK